mmetsp:Transcript_4233/g.12162  ORF Transcript_4233/g.12162 Transcript_4233/m.12162 type:complete len:243 (-) Transcript_4233:689-1417(-)
MFRRSQETLLRTYRIGNIPNKFRPESLVVDRRESRVIDLESNQNLIRLVHDVFQWHVAGIFTGRIACTMPRQAVALGLGVGQEFASFFSRVVDQDPDLFFQNLRDLCIDLGIVRIETRLLRQSHRRHHKGSDLCQRNRCQPELALADVQDRNLLSDGFPLDERSGNAGPRLADPKGPHDGFREFDVALVFVTPADKVDPVRNHVFLDTVFGSPSPIAVLVQGEDVEPTRIVIVLLVGCLCGT